MWSSSLKPENKPWTLFPFAHGDSDDPFSRKQKSNTALDEQKQLDPFGMEQNLITLLKPYMEHGTDTESADLISMECAVSYRSYVIPIHVLPEDAKVVKSKKISFFNNKTKVHTQFIFIFTTGNPTNSMKEDSSLCEKENSIKKKPCRRGKRKSKRQKCQMQDNLPIDLFNREETAANHDSDSGGSSSEPTPPTCPLYPNWNLDLTQFHSV